MCVIESIIDTLSHDDIWELRIGAEAIAGDSVMDRPKYDTVKIRVKGLFSYIVNQNHRIMGIAEDADAILSTVANISLDSQILVKDVTFEIVGTASAQGIHYPDLYTYSLRRIGNLP